MKAGCRPAQRCCHITYSAEWTTQAARAQIPARECGSIANLKLHRTKWLMSLSHRNVTPSPAATLKAQALQRPSSKTTLNEGLLCTHIVTAQYASASLIEHYGFEWAALDPAIAEVYGAEKLHISRRGKKRYMPTTITLYAGAVDY